MADPKTPAVKQTPAQVDAAVHTVRMQLAEASIALDAAKETRAEAEKVVREKSRLIEGLKSQLIELLSAK